MDIVTLPSSRAVIQIGKFPCIRELKSQRLKGSVAVFGHERKVLLIVNSGALPEMEGCRVCAKARHRGETMFLTGLVAG